MTVQVRILHSHILIFIVSISHIRFASLAEERMTSVFNLLGSDNTEWNNNMAVKVNNGWMTPRIPRIKESAIKENKPAAEAQQACSIFNFINLKIYYTLGKGRQGGVCMIRLEQARCPVAAGILSHPFSDHGAHGCKSQPASDHPQVFMYLF